jgi:hypothetical protein
VWKLDRLECNTQHVLAVVDELTSRGIGFRSLTEGLHTDGPMGKVMLTIMAALARRSSCATMIGYGSKRRWHDRRICVRMAFCGVDRVA